MRRHGQAVILSEPRCQRHRVSTDGLLLNATNFFGTTVKAAQDGSGMITTMALPMTIIFYAFAMLRLHAGCRNAKVAISLSEVHHPLAFELDQTFTKYDIIHLSFDFMYTGWF